MQLCPCCTEKLLRHLCGRRYYWFCPSCWQEMPILDQVQFPKPQD